MKTQQNGGRFKSFDLEKIRRIVEDGKPTRILMHSATILSYPFFDDLVEILDKSQATIYLGSMNLINIDEQKAKNLLKLNPRHTMAAEKDTGVQLYFGLETGSDRVLKEMKKPLTRDIAIEKVKILRNIGFKHLGFYLIVGYPDTDEEDFIATAEILNTIGDIMGEGGRISVKCTPFLPHLGTETSEKQAKYWVDCVRELNLIKNLTSGNIEFDISDPFYYLTSIVLTRGGRDHSRLLREIISRKNLEIKGDEDINSLLTGLNLPSLGEHLKGKSPLDLSLSREPFIKVDGL